MTPGVLSGRKARLYARKAIFFVVSLVHDVPPSSLMRAGSPPLELTNLHAT